jgi:hypothetical protein
MVEINQLKKVDDILNSEGTILGLYKQKNGNLFLSSYLKDGSGDVFYSTDKEILKKYFNAEMTLKQVYLESDDFLVSRKFRSETATFLKDDFNDRIQCGDSLFSELSRDMRNDKLASEFLDS